MNFDSYALKGSQDGDDDLDTDQHSALLYSVPEASLALIFNALLPTSKEFHAALDEDVSEAFELRVEKPVPIMRTVSTEIYSCSEGHKHADIHLRVIFGDAADVDFADSQLQRYDSCIKAMRDEAQDCSARAGTFLAATLDSDIMSLSDRSGYIKTFSLRLIYHDTGAELKNNILVTDHVRAGLS